MSILLAQMRLAQINTYRADLEYKIQLISSAKLDLSSQINDMVGLGSDMEPDSPEMKELEKRRERLELVEKRLDERMQRYQVQLQMVEAEYQTCKQMVDKNIQYSYGS